MIGSYSLEKFQYFRFFPKKNKIEKKIFFDFFDFSQKNFFWENIGFLGEIPIF
jgi:hypothetical protein